MQNQAYVFAVFILNGFIIGILFDIFRILRKSFKTPDIVTYIEDVLFWIISGFIVLFLIFKFNNGELRLYIFLGIILGFISYLLVFSKIFIKISIEIINIIKKIVIFIFKPIKFLITLFYRPVTFVFINIRKIMSFFKVKLKIKTFHHINSKNKKDFV